MKAFESTLMLDDKREEKTKKTLFSCQYEIAS